jgi:hypothetical protein
MTNPTEPGPAPSATPAPATTAAAAPRRTRPTVTAQTDDNQSLEESPVETPVEIAHTPTLPVGQVSNYAEGVTNIPPGTPITVAADPTKPLEATLQDAQATATGVTVSQAPGTIEVAAPAPLPRPGDEQLTRGTAAHAELQEELTGQAPEMPDDSTSEAAAQAQREAETLRLEQQRDAAEAAQRNQQKLYEANARQQEAVRQQQEPAR